MSLAFNPQPLNAEQRELVDAHLPMVEHLVLRVSSSFPRHVDRGDLISAGMVGLVEAAMRYDEARGVPFSRYAARRIRGSVLDAVRSTDWAPRSARQLSRAADSATQELAARSGRIPTDAELAAEIGISLAELTEMRGRIQRGVIHSLEARTSGDGARIEDRLTDTSVSGPDELLEQEELKGYLRAAIEHLPERHRIVVVGHYFEQRSFEELASFLGVTPSRISQLRSDAVEMIKDGIEAQYEPPSSEKVVGRVALRQARFASEIASHSDWRSRIDKAARTFDSLSRFGIDGVEDGGSTAVDV
ncbi:MAG: FliA/WhiG family RNA polymerase sigma factor [Acidimicrobiia bacterium]